jgi:hypothetical protein
MLRQIMVSFRQLYFDFVIAFYWNFCDFFGGEGDLLLFLFLLLFVHFACGLRGGMEIRVRGV